MSFLKDLKKFALRGNLIDMAVGFTVGAAFSTIAKSLVSDIIMPPVGLLLGRTDFSDLYFLLKAGEKAQLPYLTLKDAQSAGAVTINYGVFINNLIAFLVVALAMFMLIRLINRLDDELGSHFGRKKQAPEEPDNKKCELCLSTIPYQALKCAYCTTDLPNPSPKPA